MKKEKDSNFPLFLAYFPEVELPVILTDELHYTFSKENKPIPEELIRDFIYPLETKDPDELTEYIPCFQLSDTSHFHAIVYWKAELMTYEYVLVTFNKRGQLIEKKVIAGTKAHHGALAKSVATITEDWEIIMVGGVREVNEDSNYDPSASQSLNLELLPTGQIVGANPSNSN